jgi:hypothetical protein
LPNAAPIPRDELNIERRTALRPRQLSCLGDGLPNLTSPKGSDRIRIPNNLDPSARSISPTAHQPESFRATSESLAPRVVTPKSRLPRSAEPTRQTWQPLDTSCSSDPKTQRTLGVTRSPWPPAPILRTPKTLAPKGRRLACLETGPKTSRSTSSSGSSCHLHPCDSDTPKGTRATHALVPRAPEPTSFAAPKGISTRRPCRTFARCCHLQLSRKKAASNSAGRCSAS